MTLQIRHAAPPNADALMALHGASWRASYGPYVPEHALGAPLDANMRRRWVPWPQDRMILVAEYAGTLQGFAAVDWQNGALLDNLHVHPDVRGAGVGEALLRATCRELVRKGAAALRLFVIEDNAGARRFYNRLGGVEGRAIDDTLLGQPVRMVPVRFDGAVFDALGQELSQCTGKDA